MSFIDFAFRMFPYWSMGAFMGWAVWKSDYKDLLRFEWKPFSKFFLFMCLLTVYRYWMIKAIIASGMGANLQAVTKVPVGGVFFVGWEDLCHSAPLVILQRMIGTKKWTWPIHALCTAMVMLSFMTGHLYQGFGAAMFISLYILFGISFGKKRGFGTLIAGHMLYDFLTIMTIRMALGL
jgi:hypothetical protein